jgi:hypothetical protein
MENRLTFMDLKWTAVAMETEVKFVKEMYIQKCYLTK